MLYTLKVLSTQEISLLPDPEGFSSSFARTQTTMPVHGHGMLSFLMGSWCSCIKVTGEEEEEGYSWEHPNQVRSLGVKLAASTEPRVVPSLALMLME